MKPESLRVKILLALAYAAAAAVFAFPLGPGSVAISAGLGGFVGGLASAWPGHARLRSTTLALLFPAGVLAALAARWLFGGSASVAMSLGSERALGLSDALSFFMLSSFFAAGLRGLGRRYAAVGVLEVFVAALAAAELFAVHRNGAINRPFELADRVLEIGGDPTDVFLAVGLAGALVFAILLLRVAKLRRGLLHLLAASLLLGLLALLFPVFEVPIPEVAPTGVGLRNEPNPSRPEEDPNSREELDFDGASSNGGDRPPVAVVTFHNDYSSDAGIYFFRQASLSQWNGTRLVHAGKDVDRDVADGFPYPELAVTPPPSSHGRVEVLTSVGLLAEHFRPFGLEAPVRFEAAENPDPRRFRRTYRVVSSALVASDVELLGAAAGDPSWSEVVREHYLEGPPDARYQELAERILEELLPADLRAEPLAQVRAISTWLEREGTYSLNVKTPPSAGEPTAAFLFGDLVGYCVHFSHAAALLYRSLGLPARVATGYAIPEQARRGGSSLLLTDAFGHAWAEVYLEGIGWLIADVQPQNSLDAPPPLPDADLTRLLGELKRSQDESVLPGEEVARKLPSLRELARVFGAGLAALALLLVLGLYAAKVARRLGSGSATRVYRARLDALSELGHRRMRGETPEAFARRLAPAVPSLEALTAAHLASAFGGEASRPSPEPEALTARVRKETATLARLPRRILAMLDPVSWLFSR